jgi:hypothetical protein
VVSSLVVIRQPSRAALAVFTISIALGCTRPTGGDGANLVLGADDASLIDGFKALHSPLYRVYSLGPDRDAIHDLLSKSFVGRALTQEYVEHYTTIVRMLGERTAIDVLRVDYEEIRITDRTPRRVRLDVDWSVGGVVTHQNHQHLRVNRYQAVYTVVERSDGLRITDTRVRNSERLQGMPYTAEGWPLDENPSSGLGFMDPLDLLRAGVGNKDEAADEAPDPTESSSDTP